MKDILEQGAGIVLTGTVFGIGIFVRLLLWGYYSRLEKACGKFDVTKNKTIQYIRTDLSRRTQHNIGMKSAMVYTECRLAECSTCGIRLGILEGMFQQSVLLVVLSSVLTSFACVVWGCDVRQVLWSLFAGGCSFFVLLLVDLFLGLREKHKRIRLLIRDYIENGKGMSAEATAATEEMPKREKRVRKKRVEKERSERKERVKPVKVKRQRRKKTGKAQEEKRRLTEELLRERRQLEARRFAEQPKSEPVVKEPEQPVQPIQQVQAEAAATQISYETMLNEVLQEYLA